MGVLCTGSRVAVGVLCAGRSSVKDSGCCNCALCVQAMLGAVTVCALCVQAMLGAITVCALCVQAMLGVVTVLTVSRLCWVL